MTSSKSPGESAENSSVLEPDAGTLATADGTAAPPGAPPPPTPAAGQVTREQLARVVGKNERTIRRWERTRLAPAVTVGPDGVHRFDLQRVSELLEVRERDEPASPDAYDGEMAREAFRLFDDGSDQVDVVRRTGFDPRAVKAMYKEWTSMRGGFFVPAEIAAKIASLSWLDGPSLAIDGTAEKLLACVERTRPRERCTVCEHRQPEFCSECVHGMTVRGAKQRAVEARLAEELKTQQKEQAQFLKTVEKTLRRKRVP
jgi:hypothetical protein